jgi:hypothetical protein
MKTYLRTYHPLATKGLSSVLSSLGSNLWSKSRKGLDKAKYSKKFKVGCMQKYNSLDSIQRIGLKGGEDIYVAAKWKM